MITVPSRTPNSRPKKSSGSFDAPRPCAVGKIGSIPVGRRFRGYSVTDWFSDMARFRRHRSPASYISGLSTRGERFASDNASTNSLESRFIATEIMVLERQGKMLERRAISRHRVFKAGTIEFDGARVDCIVRNISPLGAALDIVSPTGIPHEVILNILANQQRQHCYIVWRQEKRIGVMFDLANQ
jgi:hypothetical protein